MNNAAQILWFNDIGLGDLARVGGKNASLGEMVRELAPVGVRVPPGFAVSAQVFRDYLRNNHLDKPLADELAALQRGAQTLAQTGRRIRQLILRGEFTAEQAAAITSAYQRLCDLNDRQAVHVAVRSSATAEDLPQASFAGQQESYLNIRGAATVLDACRHCFASLYTDRAIAYREEQGFAHLQVALSVGVQQMVRSDRAGAGVMFTLDTETGFPDVVLINAAWGLGELVVKGHVNPDRYMVHKPLLSDEARFPIIEKRCGGKREKLVYNEGEGATLSAATTALATSGDERAALVLSDGEILQLARWAVAIERHYGRAMDIEWAKDGVDGELYILQARPETIVARRDPTTFTHYTLRQKSRVLVEGTSVGAAIATGTLHYIASPDQGDNFPADGILVTERTDPDWVPLMRRAAGVITDTGGTTSHAAIVSRELKVPAVVGTGNATAVLADGGDATLCCAEGARGKVYEGILAFDTDAIRLDDIPPTRTAIMINAAIPDAALRWWQLPAAGIGLTRIEFMISSEIKVHPMALLQPEKIGDRAVREQIAWLTAGYADPGDYFVDTLALGIGKIAASCFPKPVIVRLSDFKTNEYRGLLGGEFFEFDEANPMLGFRGASRYYHSRYQAGFELECRAIKRVRERLGFANVIVMIPFCRTPREADQVINVLNKCGLRRGENGLQIYVMCEIPSNVILADQFARRFDGFSIGSNDLTQLVLGVDRESALLQPLFDARDEAVKRMIAQVIEVAHAHNCKVGICGQAPSDHPDFAEFLVRCGIDSISLNPDSVVKVSHAIAQVEMRLA